MRIIFYIIISVMGLSGCFNHTYKVEDFTEKELIWYKPYTTTHKVIYLSDLGEKDTIIFYATKLIIDSVRNFKLGFYNNHLLFVKYELSKGSYHKPQMITKDLPYDNWFVKSLKSSAGYGHTEITFIGLLFSNKIKRIKKINDSTYYFDSKNADYIGIDGQNVIKCFEFNVNYGIIEFIDDRNIKWKRKFKI